jgi:subtilisin family serine protease
VPNGENICSDTVCYDAWVEFVDKGISTEKQKARMYEQLEKNYNTKAIERRKAKRTFPGLFDERDFPVSETYINEIRKTGARVMIISRWMNGLSVLATEEQLSKISNLECVNRVGDRHEHISERHLYDDPGYTQHFIHPGSEPYNHAGYEEGFYGLSKDQIEQIGLRKVHEQGYTGKGVVIAILDTGFDIYHEAFNHPDHPLEVIRQWDLVYNDTDVSPDSSDAIGQHLHGTLCLGIIAAYMPGKYIGSAYEATYILCKPEDVIEEYPLEERWFVAALEYAESHGADIISSSLVIYDHYTKDQMDGKTSVMAMGWNIATGNGIIGVQGAGNAGHDTDPNTNHLETPGDAFQVITIGAVDKHSRIARFSSDGPTADGRMKPEILGRGLDTYTVSGHENDLYTTASGVSMATPLVAGGIACLFQARKEWTLEEFRTNLFRSGDFYRRNQYADTTSVQGYGIPDFSLVLK